MLGSLLFDTVYTARERLSRGSDGVEAATRGTFAVAVQPSSILIPNQDVESAPDLLLARGHVLACVSAELPAAPDFVAPKAEHGVSRNYFENFEAHFRRDPIKFIKQISEYVTGYGWRGYEWYIGEPVLYPTCGTTAVKKLLASRRVTQKIEELSLRMLASTGSAALAVPGYDHEKELDRHRRHLEKRAQKLAEGLCTQISDKKTVQRFMCAVHIVLARLYNEGVHLNMKEYGAFREAAELAAQRKQSLLILPNHKSYIDSMIVSWLMYRLGHSLPTCITTDSLNIPVLGNLLKKTGGAFIKRPFGEDPLYPIIVKEYLEQLLGDGINMEIFIEGTRSRTGKLLPPKVGMLKYVIDALQMGRTSDVIICPVSIQYSNVLELDTFSDELLGVPKTPESLAGLVVNGGKALQRKLGRIDFRFKTPFSLKKFLAERAERELPPASTTSRPDRPKDAALLKSLSYRVFSDINSISPVVPAAAVAATLLCTPKKGMVKHDLLRRVGWLKSALALKGVEEGPLRDLSGAEIIVQSLDPLGDALTIRSDDVDSVFLPTKPFVLALYRNQLANTFVLEGILAVSLIGRSTPATDAFERATFLSTLLQQEFVFPPEGVKSNFEDAVSQLSAGNVVGIRGEELEPLPSRHAAEALEFYSSLVHPFINTYWMMAVTVKGLSNPSRQTPGAVWYRQSDVVGVAQKLATHLHSRGETCIESANQVTLSQALQHLVSTQLVSAGRTGSSVPTIGLPREQDKAQQLINRLEEVRGGALVKGGQVELEMIVQKLAPKPVEMSNKAGQCGITKARL